MVVLVLQLLLLHLQGHQFLALQVGHIIGGGRGAGRSGVALWRGDALVGLVPPFVLLVVERGEGENVQKEQRRPHGDGDTELRGVVPLGFDHHGRLVGQIPALALVGRLFGVGRRNSRVAGGGRPVVFTGEPFGVGIGSGVLRRDLSGSGYILKKLIYVVKMRNQFQPEGNLSSSVVVPNPRFEADVKVELVFGVVLGPGYLLEAVRLRVDELSVLWNRLVWISERET